MKKRFRHLLPFAVHFKPRLKLVVLTVLISYGVSGCNVALPLLYRNLTDRGLFRDGAIALSMAEIGMWVAVIFGVLVLRRTIQSIVRYTSTLITSGVGNDMRAQLFGHLQHAPLDFYDENQAGWLVSNITNDVNRLESLSHDILIESMTAPITLIASLAMVFWVDPVLGALSMLLFPVLYAIMRRKGRTIRGLSRQNQAALAALTMRFLETVTNVRVVRAFRREVFEGERFGRLNTDALSVRLQNVRLSILVDYMSDLLTLAGMVALGWLCLHRVQQGRVAIGDLVALFTYVNTMRAALASVIRIYASYQQAVGGSQRLIEILNTKPRLLPEPKPVELPGGPRGVLELIDVDFSYPDGTRVLKGANLRIEAGEKVALIGPSGVGKSTLASLILGLYDIQGGSIRIDGVDIRDLGLDRALGVVSMVPQDIGLFSGTVRENLAYAKLDATDEEIEEASRLANAHGFIGELSNGYDTFVGDQGVRLSGGQRQRLAIARAILRNPRILILDEATSHVDPETEALVQKALSQLLADRTSLIIAHHDSAIRDVDRVVEMRDQQIRPVAEAKLRR